MILYILYMIFTAATIVFFVMSRGKYDSAKHGEFIKFIRSKIMKIVFLFLLILNALVFLGLHVVCGIALSRYISGYGY